VCEDKKIVSILIKDGYKTKNIDVTIVTLKIHGNNTNLGSVEFDSEGESLPLFSIFSNGEV
jgi:hypothetical protein